MLVIGDGEHAGQFIAGWLTEYSLSIDNLFVFVIIMARFAVPAKLQQEVLMIGIVIALVLRGIFILLGAQLIENFSWIFYIFGAFLLYTAYQQAFGSEHEDEEDKDNRVHPPRSAARPDDRRSSTAASCAPTSTASRVFTPMLIVFLAIGATDLLFALDSIPAIFGITESPFIVFTANIFALMGLRQLYFLLGGLLDTPPLPEIRHRRHPRLHRREARAARDARERTPVHQRRPIHRVGARNRHADVAVRHPRDHGAGRPSPASSVPASRRAAVSAPPNSREPSTSSQRRMARRGTEQMSPRSRASPAGRGIAMGKTLAEKVWDDHVVVKGTDGSPDLLYIDLHLLHEVTSPQAFDGLRLAGRPVRRPDLTIATEDHNTPTINIDKRIADDTSRIQIETLRQNAEEFGIRLHSLGDKSRASCTSSARSWD